MIADIIRCPCMYIYMYVQYALSLKTVLVACEGPCMLSTFKHVECIIWLKLS